MHTARILLELGENGMLARAGGRIHIFKENIASKDEATEFASKIIDLLKSL